MNFIITFVFRWLKALDTTGLEHMVNRKIHLSLIPMPFSHSSGAFGLLSYFIWVFLHAFLTEFWFRILYPIVSFCVSGVLHVLAHRWRGSFSNLVLMIQHRLWCMMLSKEFLTLICLLAFVSWHGIIYINILFTLLFSMGPLLLPLRTI